MPSTRPSSPFPRPLAIATPPRAPAGSGHRASDIPAAALPPPCDPWRDGPRAPSWPPRAGWDRTARRSDPPASPRRLPALSTACAPPGPRRRGWSWRRSAPGRRARTAPDRRTRPPDAARDRPAPSPTPQSAPRARACENCRPRRRAGDTCPSGPRPRAPVGPPLPPVARSARRTPAVVRTLCLCRPWSYVSLASDVPPQVRRFGTKVSYYLEPPRQKRYQVTEHLVDLRVVQHLVVHLRVPADPHAALQAVGERARLMRVHHAVLARQQKQQRRFDAIPVRHHGPLGPLDLAPRPRRHHAVHGCVLGVRLIHGRIPAQRVGIESRGNRQGRPQVREDAPADEFPRRRPKREPEPGPGDHRTGDRVARLGLEVAQRHEPSEREPEQHLGALGADAHHATERLQVAEQLAEAGQMSGPPS